MLKQERLRAKLGVHISNSQERSLVLKKAAPKGVSPPFPKTSLPMVFVSSRHQLSAAPLTGPLWTPAVSSIFPFFTLFGWSLPSLSSGNRGGCGPRLPGKNLHDTGSGLPPGPCVPDSTVTEPLAPTMIVGCQPGAAGGNLHRP